MQLNSSDVPTKENSIHFDALFSTVIKSQHLGISRENKNDSCFFKVVTSINGQVHL